ncbi:DinB family protein [Flavobacterium lacisediminis]|uniref:DinB family protein n=1 Tax=Flavobacterium lacisediminis TaxID=2989705 RepID=A0ABT3EK23_9FLAO|nr:DinB family protein [Flavobacterium lacisediminis]MCW1148923.1 DinB family protein [Flavobacterium lacisediminis]
MLIQNVKNNLSENIELLRQLTNDEFTQKNPELSNATIGEHMRHIIELFGCLLENYDCGVINYDDRKRDLILQTDKNEAINRIEKYLHEIDKTNKTLSLAHNCFSPVELLPTNYFRELVYNLEHSIHHQALIKVALHRLPHIRISNSFGVAPSTLEYRRQCAQ